MYNENSVIEKKVEFLKNQLETIQLDFRTNLKPSLIKYEYNALTKLNLENIQREIDYFLYRHQLKISVHISMSNQKLKLIGDTLVDEIVWEQIQ
ncbi:MAG: hypothetical protein M0R17_08660 [Candidatus Omnitrophica bacterium]|jgi:hypothetical protein|nr:hypothetical protein [Candidatus Omnitrophota bacterium]